MVNSVLLKITALCLLVIVSFKLYIDILVSAVITVSTAIGILYVKMLQIFRLHDKVLLFLGYRQLTEVEKDYLQPIMAEICNRLRISSIPKIVFDENDEGVGFYDGLISTIVLTKGSFALPPDQLKAVLIHEIGHYVQNQPFNYRVFLLILTLFIWLFTFFITIYFLPYSFFMLLFLYILISPIYLSIIDMLCKLMYNLFFKSADWQTEYIADQLVKENLLADQFIEVLKLYGVFDKRSWKDYLNTYITHPPLEDRMRHLLIKCEKW